MTRTPIHTDNAPAAIGTYSQAIKIGTTVYLSGQIPLHPSSMESAIVSHQENARLVEDGEFFDPD